MAVCVILVYDYMLTFGREVELFWHRPSRALGGTVIFMLNRVVGVGLAILGNVNTDLSRYTYASCKYTILVEISITLLAYAIWAAVSAIRVHALTKRNWLLSMPTLALALVPMVADMWLTSTITFSITPVGPLIICSESSPISVRLNTMLLIISRGSSLASDLIVLLVTLYYVCPRPWLRATLPSRSLSRVLLRNGILYFLRQTGSTYSLRQCRR
ncbi:uncharacterized protein B0H18DRAFT_368379 [Fomitopsis serialis]|uniref:uncharacterized protein n=1 Tax=Fomitopsis serialis TaxID=139415 RepID=UPI00200751D3|nr:uncharacterized protein B0H18DRAFT_368379 [Neoantrodia serialis]KAH9925807.1 hypothetical protein B0H18DRAFT_368379 [Neoantrodia serialis]